MLPKQENYSLARQLAVEGLGRSNLPERAARSGGRYEQDPGGEARIVLRYLGGDLRLSFPRGTIEGNNGQRSISLREEILILHYLGKASGAPLADRWISFSDIPEGVFYSSVFLMRCKSPLIKFFGEDPQDLLAVAEEVEGEPLDLGDTGIRIQAFPRVPIAVALWKGDAEFPAEGSLLFDASVNGYLSAEDIIILAETVVWKLIRAKR
jgi:hypothetical protein